MTAREIHRDSPPPPGAHGGSLSRIQVMIVDDSAVVRQVLSDVLKADPGIEVLCAVADPLLAMERMKMRWPQVIVLDVEMPRMDGLTFLRKIMSERPTPVVICSTLTEAGAATTLEALAAGAVSIVTKPKMGLRSFIEDASADLIGAVRAAAHANVKKLRTAHAAERFARRALNRLGVRSCISTFPDVANVEIQDLTPYEGHAGAETARRRARKRMRRMRSTNARLTPAPSSRQRSRI